jgi:hypothetical protein
VRLSGTTDIGLTYPILQREVRRRAVRSILTEGPGGPLVFLWALGTSLFLVPLGLPLLIVPLSIAAVAIGWRMFAEYARDQTVRARLARSVIQSWCPPPRGSDPAVNSRLDNGQHLFIEITLKIMDGSSADRDPSRERLIAQAAEMLCLLYESARQAQEFDRVLQIVGEAQASPITGDEGSHLRHLPGLLSTNVAALRQEVERASDLTAELVEHMQTLLLQLTQLGVPAMDLVRGAESAREARESIEWMQVEVSTRQAVADEVIADLGGPSETAWMPSIPIEKGL